MPSFGSKILNNAVSALNAQQAAIATTANNISNVNTPGYARRSIELQTRSSLGQSGSIQIGNGVEIGQITRSVDEYLETQLRGTISNTESAKVIDEFLSRVEPLFSVTSGSETIGSALNGFFIAAQDLASDPSSLELRAVFVERARDVVGSITSTFQAVGALQQEADERLDTEVAQVNSLTTQIAELNERILGSEGSGNIALDERDKRDYLLRELSKRIEYQTINVSDGSVSVVLSNGFTLVSGSTQRELSVIEDPSFSSGSLPQSLSGNSLRYIVYDYSNGAGTSHVDFTETLSKQEGSIGGLLKVRGYVDPSLTDPSAFQADGHLVEIASRIEAITRQLLTTVNQTYLGPDRSVAAGYQPSSGDLNGNTPGVYGLFDFNFNGVKDTDGDLYPDDIGTHSVGNYSTLLTLAIDDPTEVAAARDATPGDPSPTFLEGDGRNMEALANIRATDFNFAAGSFALTGSFEEVFNESVTTVSNKRSRSELNLSVSESNQLSAEGKRDSVAGVSLDEEFTTLIKNQKAFEAAARLIKTAQALLDEIVNLV